MNGNEKLSNQLQNLTKGKYDELSEYDQIAARRGFLKCGLNNFLFGKQHVDDPLNTFSSTNERCVIFFTQFTGENSLGSLEKNPEVIIWTNSFDVVETLQRVGAFDYDDLIDNYSDLNYCAYCIRTTLQDIYQSLETKTMREAEEKYPLLAKIKQTPLWTDAKGLLQYQNGVPLILLRPITPHFSEINKIAEMQQYVTRKNYNCDAGNWVGQQLLNYFNTQSDSKLIIEHCGISQSPKSVFCFYGVPFTNYRDTNFAESTFTTFCRGQSISGSDLDNLSSNPFELSGLSFFKGYDYSVRELPKPDRVIRSNQGNKINHELSCYYKIPLIEKQMLFKDGNVLAFPLDQYIKMSLEKQLDGSIHRIARENGTCATDDQINKALRKLKEIMTPTLQNGSVEQVSSGGVSQMRV